MLYESLPQANSLSSKTVNQKLSSTAPEEPNLSRKPLSAIYPNSVTCLEEAYWESWKNGRQSPYVSHVAHVTVLHHQKQRKTTKEIEFKLLIKY